MTQLKRFHNSVISIGLQNKKGDNMPRLENLNIENARIIFRNFSGKPDRYDKIGHKNFKVILDAEQADVLSRDGWNIQVRHDNRDPDGDDMFLLPVQIRYDIFPPKIYMITEKNSVLLDEESVAELDDADIKKIDLVIRPYQWEVNGKSGVKAYVRKMYVTIEEDIFASKYKFKDAPVDDDETPF